jgi:hypothetical protein
MFASYRFESDPFCRAQRFAAYHEKLGSRLIGRVLPDSAANPDAPPFFEKHVPNPHSVVTVHLFDEAGEPTIKARDEILSFFAYRLSGGPIAAGMGCDWRVGCPPVGWVEPVAKPIMSGAGLMGIASLHPSYALIRPFLLSTAGAYGRGINPAADIFVSSAADIVVDGGDRG